MQITLTAADGHSFAAYRAGPADAKAALVIVQEIFGIMRRIRGESGVGILLVEQNANLALELADRAYLIETGHIVTSGPAAEIRQDEAIRRAYLGY